jgi:beta-N-acetylhexosaminidase
LQSVEEIVGQRLLLAFQGKDRIPDDFLKALQTYRPAGITLFRAFNVDNPAQVRRLTGQLQEAARRIELPPLLMAVDQEGGQLMAIGPGTTLLPGNMALGATRDPALARRAGDVLGAELRAMGVNLNYAPCCDVLINPQNPVIGIRSFGEDPLQVSELATAMIGGIQSRGVAATAKHFPGHGDTAGDSHYELPSLPHSLERLQQVEFPPFGAAIMAGVKMIMTAHVAVPAIDGPDAPPATLSAAVLKGLLRGQLGFDGVIITDAMDMHAIPQGEALGENAVRAVEAGADLLLMMSDPADQRCVHAVLKQAVEARPGALSEYEPSLERVAVLKEWLANQPAAPGIDVVGCAAHQEVADEIARRSVTLIRNTAGLLPLRLPPEARVAALVPRPADLTPADTSSYVVPTLAASLRVLHPNVEELVASSSPMDQEIAGLVERLRGFDLIVLGTLNAFSQPGQQALVAEVLKTGIPTVVVAMRLPYDLTVFPQASTYVCTYSVLEPSMRALAAAIFGENPFDGRLPVSIPGLYAIGFGQRL